jgi:hypothetical protein
MKPLGILACVACLVAASVSVLLAETAAPVAVAGPNQLVSFGDSVVLDGSGTTGDLPLTYQWTVPPTASPNNYPDVDLVGADTQVAKFKAPDQVQSILVRLVVSDATAAADTDDVIITIIEDVANAVFACPLGDDANDGTYARPFATLDRAVEVAAGRSPRGDIYLTKSTFSTVGVRVLDGMSLYGGFRTPAMNPDGTFPVWDRLPDRFHPWTVITGAAVPIEVCDVVAHPTVISSLFIEALDGSGGRAFGEPGQNSIGIRVVNCNENLAIFANAIKPGKGGYGYLGGPGEAGTAGSLGEAPTTAGLIGGAGGTGVNGHRGGKGGNGGMADVMMDYIKAFTSGDLWAFYKQYGEADFSPAFGDRGQDGNYGTLGGQRGRSHMVIDWLTQDFPIQLYGSGGAAGDSGLSGVSGLPGEGGSGPGLIRDGDWVGPSGIPGGSGEDGQGGGGGGGGGAHVRFACYYKWRGICLTGSVYRTKIVAGGAGGGGGGGGGGGVGGAGGGAGGGSFGMLLVNSAPVVSGNGILLGTGGNGGPGGNGGLGAGAGAGVDGFDVPQERAGDGGRGGRGGFGGDGAGGGGGCGGNACGILLGQGSSLLGVMNSFDGTAAGGFGGQGGWGGREYNLVGQRGDSGTGGTICGGSDCENPFGTVTLHQDEEFEGVFGVGEEFEAVFVGIGWRGGGEVNLSLVSPSGEVVDGSVVDGDIGHWQGPWYEYYMVTGPEVGEWTLRLVGQRAREAGVDVDFCISRVPVNHPPVANAGYDQTLLCSGTGLTRVMLNGMLSRDPDGDQLTYLWEDEDHNVVGTQAVCFTSVPVGIYTFRLTVSDGRGGTSSDEKVAIIRDTVPPNLLIVQPVVTITTDLPGGIEVDLGGTASATDNCDPDPTIGFEPPSGSVFPLGLTEVTCTATDACGNSTAGSIQVVVTSIFGEVVGDVMAVDTVHSESWPLESIAVNALDSGGQVVRSAPTNADGHYELDSLLVGATYDIVVEPRTCYYPEEGAVEVTVTPFPKEVCFVLIEDATPPEITVELNRHVLWPPNHKMVDIAATVQVADNCDPAPTFALTSITSSEPDNGLGDGDKPKDIQGAELGTPDLAFALRAERSGLGPRRIYTILYTATDMVGNTAQAVATVRVPHDKNGYAQSSAGFSMLGTEFQRGASEFSVVIPDLLPAGQPDPGGMREATFLEDFEVYVGNTCGAIRPLQTWMGAGGGGGLRDVVLVFDAPGARAIAANSDVLDGPLGLHYQIGGADDYLVPNVFLLGQPVPLPDDTDQPGEGAGVDETLPDPEVTCVRIQRSPSYRSATILMDLAGNLDVSLEIYDVRGSLVRTLARGAYPAGRSVMNWDGRSDNGQEVASGIYVVRFDTGAMSSLHKVVLVK